MDGPIQVAFDGRIGRKGTAFFPELHKDILDDLLGIRSCVHKPGGIKDHDSIILIEHEFECTFIFVS